MYKIISIKQQKENIEKLRSLNDLSNIIEGLTKILDKEKLESSFSGRFFSLIKSLSSHREKDKYFKSYACVIDLINKLLFPAKFDVLSVNQNMFFELKKQCEEVKKQLNRDIFFLEVQIQFKLNCPILIQDKVLNIIANNDKEIKELSFKLNSENDCFAPIKEDLKHINDSIKDIFSKLTENLSSDFNKLLYIIIKTQIQMELLYKSEKTRCKTKCEINVCAIS